MKKIKLDEYKAICSKFKKRWNECTSLEEMDKLREEFFNLPLGEERLEKGWDYITIGEEIREIRTKRRIDVPMKIVISLRNQGYTAYKIGKMLGINPQTIRNRLREREGIIWKLKLEH